MKLSKKIRNTVFIAMSFAMIGSLTLTGCSDGSSDDDTTSITKEEQKPEDNKEEQKTEDNKEEQKTEDNKEEQKPEDNKEEQKTEDNKEEQKTEDTNKTDPSETVTITLKSMELIYEKSGDNESVVFKQEITDAEQCKKFIKGNKIKVELDVNAINKSSDALTSDVIFEFIDGGSDVEWWKTITKEASKQTLTKDSKITWEVELTDDISKGDKSEAKKQKAVLFFKLDAETAKSDDKVYVNKDLPKKGDQISVVTEETDLDWNNDIAFDLSSANPGDKIVFVLKGGAGMSGKECQFINSSWEFGGNKITITCKTKADNYMYYAAAGEGASAKQDERPSVHPIDSGDAEFEMVLTEDVIKMSKIFAVGTATMVSAAIVPAAK